MLKRKLFFGAYVLPFAILSSLAQADGKDIRISMHAKGGANESGAAAGADAVLYHDNSGASGKLDVTGSPAGLRSRLILESPIVSLGSGQSILLVRDWNNALGGQIYPVWKPLKIDGLVTLSKDGGQTQVGQARALGSSELALESKLVGSGPGYLQGGSVSVGAGVAGGVVNDSRDGVAAVAGPKVGAEVAWMLLSKGYTPGTQHGIGIRADASYIYNLAGDLEHVLSVGGEVDYILSLQNGPTLHFGPEAVYNLADVKKSDGSSESDGQSFFVGGHAGVAF